MKFNKRDFRYNVRRTLLSAHGVTVKTCTREQLTHCVNQCIEAQWALYDDKHGAIDAMTNCVKDLYTGK